MKYTLLGRTGLKSSIAGLGCGGHSRIGIEKGERHAVSVVNAAFDLGINFFDTSQSYGTEEAIGKGLSDKRRESYIISSKFPPIEYQNNNALKPEGSLTAALEQSLIKLKTDYIDIYHLHAVRPSEYFSVRDRFIPELIKAKESGKIGWFGITEMFAYDTRHEMLEKALGDNLWDVVMTGLNILNFSAKENVLPITTKNNVGTLLMFAVRNALSNEEKLKEVLNYLDSKGEIDMSMFDITKPLDFLIQDSASSSVVEAAYRFCSNTDGINVVLTGTSSAAHLKDNVKSILSPKLPECILSKIFELFKNSVSVSGE